MGVNRREMMTSAIAGAVVLLAGCTTSDTTMGHKNGDYSEESLRDVESVHGAVTKSGFSESVSEEGEHGMAKFLLIKSGLDNVADSLDNIADAIREHN